MKFGNLNKDIIKNVLEHSDFGHPEAEKDKTVEDKTALCETDAIREFMQGEQTILRGFQGTGKTVIYDSIEDLKLKFHEQNPSDIIIGLKEEIAYATLREEIIPRIDSKGKSETYKFRFVWEFYILYRICSKIQGDPTLPQKLSESCSYVLSTLGTEGLEKSFFTILTGSKKKVGIKFSASEVGIPVLDAYYGTEPNENQSKRQDERREAAEINVPAILDDIRDWLNQGKRKIWILIDNIDDFVYSTNFETQIKLLHGLIHTEKNYFHLKEIEMILFFRTDLYSKLSLEEVGSHKLVYRTIDLSWTPQDILSLIARRIAYNYCKYGEVRSLYIEHNESGIATERSGSTSLSLRFAKLKNKIFPWKQKFFHRTYINKEPNFNFEISRLFIESFFGDRISHLDAVGRVHEISTTDFFRTHLQYSNGITTPRIVVLFLKRCVEKARQYYRDHPQVPQDFPVIPEGCIFSAYTETKRQAWTAIADSLGKYRKAIIAMMNHSSDGFFTYGRLVEVTRISDDAAMETFIALIKHRGIASDNDSPLPLQEREFRLSKLFQIVEKAEPAGAINSEAAASPR